MLDEEENEKWGREYPKIHGAGTKAELETTPIHNRHVQTGGFFFFQPDHYLIF